MGDSSSALLGSASLGMTPGERTRPASSTKGSAKMRRGLDGMKNRIDTRDRLYAAFLPALYRLPAPWRLATLIAGRMRRKSVLGKSRRSIDSVSIHFVEFS